MEFDKVKVFVTAPKDFTTKLIDIIAESGAGKIGNYSHCTFVTKGIGSFKPNSVAKPFLGKADQLELVEEDQVQFVCPLDLLEVVIAAIRQNHPYEEPAIDVFPLVNVN
jgi:hypothetical protein